MIDRTDRQLAAASDRAEQERLDAELAAALLRHGIVVEAPAPGFATRRNNRMLRPTSTRS